MGNVWICDCYISQLIHDLRVTSAEFQLNYHEKVFRLSCHERKGAAFQTFFEAIMAKHIPSFMAVKPHGREGDWKNDGWIASTGTIFQVYSPDSTDAKKILDKINEDFHGVLMKWAGKIKEWIFVYAEQQALPPMVVSRIEELRAAHPDVTIHTWSREHLWRIVRDLPCADRNALLEPVPMVEDILRTTAAEIQVLLKYLAKTVRPSGDSTTSLLAILSKLELNQLGPDIRAFVEPGLMVASTVGLYLSHHPDPDFNRTVSESLAAKYAELATEHPNDSEQVFFALIRWVQNGEPGYASQPRYFWGAVGIVSHYFELCDIFES